MLLISWMHCLWNPTQDRGIVHASSVCVVCSDKLSKEHAKISNKGRVETALFVLAITSCVPQFWWAHVRYCCSFDLFSTQSPVRCWHGCIKDYLKNVKRKNEQLHEATLSTFTATDNTPSCLYKLRAWSFRAWHPIHKVRKRWTYHLWLWNFFCEYNFLQPVQSTMTTLVCWSVVLSSGSCASTLRQIVPTLKNTGSVSR